MKRFLPAVFILSMLGLSACGAGGSSSSSSSIASIVRLLADTGQTGCYLADGTGIVCTQTVANGVDGQDANYNTTNQPSYTDGTDTVTDDITGLIWQKCSKGLSGATCVTGAASPVAWASADSYCAGLTLGGSSSWRLPTDAELEGIINYQNIDPSINTASFPGTVLGGYWTTTVDALNNTQAWFVSFASSSSTITDAKTASYNIRCVR